MTADVSITDGSRFPGPGDPLAFTRQLVWDFRRIWVQMTVTDMVAQATTFIVFAPAIAFVLTLLLTRAGEPALANTGNLWFVLRPAGVFTVVVISALILALIFAEAAVLQLIAYAKAHERRLSWHVGVRLVAGRAVPLFQLGVKVFLRLALVAAPFVLGMLFVAYRYLTDHDINYYLAARPPEFWKAAISIGTLGAGLAGVVVWRLIAWLFALPLLLVARVPVTDVLRRSAAQTRGRRRVLALWVVGLFLANWAVVSTVGATIGLIGRWVIPDDGTSMTFVATSVALVLVLQALAGLGLTVLRRSFLALLIVRLWIDAGGDGKLSGTEPFVDRPRPLAGKRWLAVAGAAVAVTAVGSVLFVQNVDVGKAPLVTAHRGGAARAPENTMAAIERGVADGADWIEIDVQETADGTVVVLHDSDLARVGATPVKIWNASDEQLARIDIGSWFAPEFSAERVPTLGEVLLACKDRARVLIELKYYGHTQQLEQRVVEIVEALDMVDQISIMSLELSGIQKIRALRPSWPVGLLGTVVVGDPTRLDIDFLAFTSGATNRSLIRRAHARGQKVLVWTINDPVQMSMLASRGVDGLITDRPADARRVLAQRAEMSAVERLLVDLGGRFGILEGGWETSERDDA